MRRGAAGGAGRVVVVIAVALVCGGCEGSRSGSTKDAPTTAPVPSPAASVASAAPTAAAAAGPDAAPSASTTAPESAQKGSTEIEVTIVGDAEIGRPGPGVLTVANDPQFRLPVRVEKVEPADAPDFAVGEQLVLGIHSPSRMFNGGGAPKGKRVRLRLHWRQDEGEAKRYYHAEVVR